MPDLMSFRARTVRGEDSDDPIHDGDTLWLEMDRGRWIHTPEPIRLKDVHAPEVTPLQWGGWETQRFVVGWLAKWNTGKWPFWVDSFRTSTYRDVETLSRFVCAVFNRDRTSCLNVEVQQFIDIHGYPPGN